MNHYPLVCKPRAIMRAEYRINAGLPVGLAIKEAELSVHVDDARPPLPRYNNRPDKAARLEYLDHRNRSVAAHPDYGGAFDGFTVTSDADGGL